MITFYWTLECEDDINEVDIYNELLDLYNEYADDTEDIDEIIEWLIGNLENYESEFLEDLFNIPIMSYISSNNVRDIVLDNEFINNFRNWYNKREYETLRNKSI